MLIPWLQSSTLARPTSVCEKNTIDYYLSLDPSGKFCKWVKCNALRCDQLVLTPSVRSNLLSTRLSRYRGIHRYTYIVIIIVIAGSVVNRNHLSYLSVSYIAAVKNSTQHREFCQYLHIIAWKYVQGGKTKFVRGCRWILHLRFDGTKLFLTLNFKVKILFFFHCTLIITEVKLFQRTIGCNLIVLLK